MYLCDPESVGGHGSLGIVECRMEDRYDVISRQERLRLGEVAGVSVVVLHEVHTHRKKIAVGIWAYFQKRRELNYTLWHSTDGARKLKC